VDGYDPEPRERAEWILGPLFTNYQVIEYSAGTIFRGPISPYCEMHRREVVRGLRRLRGAYCFERLGGTTYLTCTLPGPNVKPVNRVLHVALFAGTVLTTLLAGAGFSFHGFLRELGRSLTGVIGSMSQGELWGALLRDGWCFSLAILLILGCHECGHYFMARRYGMIVTPPFFLPAPIPPIGTFGAVIKMRSPMLHRRALLDIGLAGPIAGLAVALPFLISGLSHAKFVWVRYLEFKGGLYFGNSLLTWGLSRLLVGVPPPGYVVDWLSHPFAWAGWIGLLVTSLNLIPVGQLDGGHVAYALFGRRQRSVAFFMFGVLLALTGRWLGWALWCLVMAVLMKVAHPPVVIEDVRLGPGRRALGWASFVLFLLIFMPAPVAGVF